MTDSTPPASAGPAGNGQPPSAAATPVLVVNAQYVKDLSFEAPSAPQVFGQLQRQQPDISVKVDVQARALDAQSHLYEVVLQIQAECKAGQMSAFIIELTYGGVFTVNTAADAIRPTLLIECPRLLFPFARHVVATATLNGGFMPLMLGPIDFASLYERQSNQPAGDEPGNIAYV